MAPDFLQIKWHFAYFGRRVETGTIFRSTAAPYWNPALQNFKVPQPETRFLRADLKGVSSIFVLRLMPPARNPARTSDLGTQFFILVCFYFPSQTRGRLCRRGPRPHNTPSAKRLFFNGLI
jgi:hypothetical protein